MIAGLQPYPAMKDSGVPWLGKVPEHWDVRRLKYLLRERDVRSDDGAEQLLRVSQYTGVTERKRADGLDEPDTRAESLVGYKSTEPNDLVVNIMLAWNGSMGVSRFHGIVSPAYCVYRFQVGVHARYFDHLLRSPTYKARIKAVSTGVVESRLRLYTDNLYRLEALLPPLPEQAAIVKYLDHVDRRIRKYIRAKQKLIKLLEEQKQAIIHQAVTRGLDPNVRLKSSGVDWLGDIPEHWEVRKLKYKVKFCGGGTPSKAVIEYWSGEIPWVSPKDMKTDFIQDTQDHITSEAVELSSTCLVDPGAVLIVVRSGILRRTIPVAINRCSVALNQDMKALIPKSDLLASYLAALIRGNNHALLTEWTKQGATVESIEYELFANSRLPIPPVSEQAAIVENLRLELSAINQAIDRAQRQISLLREYRTRLIADVVTGKLDVREAATRLCPMKRKNPCR